MEPTQGQRADLAARIRRERIKRYGTQKGAYVAADVNSATWTKAEAGRSIAPRSLVAIVKLLWPETDGDWQLIEPPLSADDLSIEDEVRTAPLSPAARDRILQLLAEDKARGVLDEEVGGA